MLYNVCRSLLRVLYAVLFRFEAQGLDNIPAAGPVILCSNHTSNLDPTTVGVMVNRKVHYMAKQELFNVPLFGPFIRALGAFPVKRGGVSKDTIRTAIALMRDGGVMGIFPEGSRRAPSGAGKKGAAMIALRSGATVIPVAITGNYRLFSKVVIRYGQPIDLSAFIQDSSSNVLDKLTETIMTRIREMVREDRGR
ncbi:lysophospholipid acyltransferase family protein [Paenibacillus humicola]|uniref:lysophospholipid acyltransferase family protein n=1 Tax=Paenibacillus humicola TaxID=3110540 RepID=UPI00237A0E68|nr:lysophospholipid acyltransferase family protein [Paenibacillus humicola]